MMLTCTVCWQFGVLNTLALLDVMSMFWSVVDYVQGRKRGREGREKLGTIRDAIVGGGTEKCFAFVFTGKPL